MLTLLQDLLGALHRANSEAARPTLRKRRANLPRRDWTVAVVEGLLDVSFVGAGVVGQEIFEMCRGNLLIEPGTETFFSKQAEGLPITISPPFWRSFGDKILLPQKTCAVLP